jgi:hypothetical protein
VAGIVGSGLVMEPVLGTVAKWRYRWMDVHSVDHLGQVRVPVRVPECRMYFYWS